MSSRRRQGAQSQHYVPKFILRQFLSNAEKQHVSVFHKSKKNGFTTSIDKIMTERRFYEFAIGDNYIASFEDGVGKIEDDLLPFYRQVLDERCLRSTDMQRAGLSLFMAFQQLRTRRQRDQFQELESLLEAKLAEMGGKLTDLENWEELTEDSLRQHHIEFMRSNIGDFAKVIAEKDFLLLEAPPGRSFYLGDNPVALHNDTEPDNPMFGSLGFAVTGIQIYLPLSSDLMLAAFCPTILQTIQERTQYSLENAENMAVAGVREGLISAIKAKEHLEHIRRLLQPATELANAFETGMPLRLPNKVMDFCNSLQLVFARDFVVCAQGDFKLARKMSKLNPKTCASVAQA